MDEYNLTEDVTSDSESDIDALSEDVPAELKCAVCLELMIEPTTLDCGHSFCRLCLAKWYLQSMPRTTCPCCQQHWSGHPKVNITLRSMIRRQHAVLYKYRSELSSNTESKDILHRFDTSLAASRHDLFATGAGVLRRHIPNAFVRQDNDNDNAVGGALAGGFCSGICVAISAFLVFLLATWLFGVERESEFLIHKPMRRWTVDDVQKWLNDLGPWTSEMAAVFLKQDIDGILLLNLAENDLIDEFHLNMSSLHIKAFKMALLAAQMQGTKLPGSLWEFKSIYPGRTMFLTYGLKHHPRLTILYSYMFEYESLFLPFIHTVSPRDNATVLIPSDETSPPSWGQWAEFLPKWYCLPYVLVFEFAYNWIVVHHWAAYFIIITCVAYTISEANWIRHTVNNPHYRNIRTVFELVKNELSSLGYVLFLYICWPFTPKFLCDIYFYYSVFIEPMMKVGDWSKGLPQITQQIYHKIFRR